MFVLLTWKKELGQYPASLLRSRFLGCHATLSPKKRLLTTEPHSFLLYFVVSLRSVEQTNYITAKCKWRKLSREKAGGANNEGFLAFVSRRTHARRQKWAVFAGYYHDKRNVNESLKYKCFMCSSLCSANERIYIFWKCLIVSVNQGLKASYRLKAGETERAAFRTSCLQIEQSYLIS